MIRPHNANGVTGVALAEAVKQAPYGINYGSKRHFIDVDSVKVVGLDGRNVSVYALCDSNQPLEHIHGVTKDPYTGKVDDLDTKPTCARCLKRKGLPPEPKKVKCPTCAGTGKVDEGSPQAVAE